MKRQVLIFLLMTNMGVAAQPLVSNIEKYTTAQGLSSNQVNALLQDSRGYIWIATEWGLNRYDGRTFKQYTHIGTGQLIHYDINSLAEDRYGNIWLGSIKGISKFDPLTETFTSWPGWSRLCADNEKNIWIINHDSIFLFDDKGIKQKFVFDIQSQTPNGNRFISHMIEGRNHTLWLSTSNGIKKLNKNTGTITEYKAASTPRNDLNSCTRLYEDEEGTIWSGTWGKGILKVNEEKGILENYQFERPYSNQINEIHDIRFGDRSYLLLSSGGTDGGLLLVDKTKGQPPKIVSRIMETATDKEPLSLNFTNILQDRQQNFWIASSDGLYKIDISRQDFHWSYLPGTDKRDNVIFHSIPSPTHPDSVIYLSSIEGWWQLNPHTLSIRPHVLPTKNAELATFINNYVPDKNGLWFTSQYGFGYYDLEKNSITDFSHIRADGQTIYRSWGLAKDSRNKLWLSLYREGLLIYDPATGHTEKMFSDSLKDDLRGIGISDLKADKTGLIWMTTNGKLFRIDPLTRAYTIFPVFDNDGISRIHITHDNRVFVWTEQNIVECRSEKIIPVFSKNLIIRWLAEDGDGNFWLQTHNNFYKLSRDFTSMIAFTYGTGLNGNIETNEISFYGNQCIIVSKGKVLSFITSSLDKQQFTAPVMISSVTADNKKYFYPAESSKKIQLGFKDRLEIEIAALNFSNEGGNRIFYKLEGWDDQWKELPGGSSLVYEQLPPGNYTLLAKASNGVAELSEQPTKLHFKIQPPIWKTWWFISLAIIAIALIAYSLYRYRLAQAIKMERLRTRIATDLHDDIGATLSSISMYSEAVKKQVKDKMPQLEPVLDKMGENSRNMVSSMNDIVWAVNPDNDQGEKLLERMESYARDTCSVADSKLHFKSNDELRQLSFSLEHRKNIYLVFKEALNNALKYSCAHNIWVTADKKGSHFQLSIKDDGKGFDTMNSDMGNGLKNMQARAKEIQAEIKITSAPGNGTTIFLDSKIS